MTLQVTGQLTGIEARSAGWFAVHVQEQGASYPRKLSTKKPELVQQAQQLMGQMVTALYNENESTNINPHTGTPYINRFLEGLSLAGQMPQQQQQPQYSQPLQQPQPMQPQPMQQQPVMQNYQQPQPTPMQQQPLPQPGQTATLTHVVRDDAARELKIHRQSAAKVAVQLLPHILAPDEKATLAGLLRISEALVRYFDEGVQWRVESPGPMNPGAYDGQQPEEYHDPGTAAYANTPPHPADDDIPF